MNKKAAYTILIIATILLITLAIGFRHTRYGGYLPHHIFRNHSALNQNDVGYIRGWMTFNYINRIFGLPRDYLKDQLKISNSEYPNISIAGEAKKEKLPENDFLASVKEAVAQYFSAVPK